MPFFIGFVPTPPEQIECFFKLAPVTKSDVIYDLGSGDGRLLFAALEKGARKAIGVEIDQRLVRSAQDAARGKGLEDRVTFLAADVMDVDLSEASLVLCYLSSLASAALKPKLEQELKPGTRVVFESFPIFGWKPVKTLQIGFKEFYLYVTAPQKSPGT